MQKIRVKVMQPDADCPHQHVHLPTYIMVPGSEKYDKKEKTKLVSVEVQVPDDECDELGNLIEAKIRQKYRGQPRWDREDVLLDVI